MKAFNNYDKTQAYTESNRLPVGGYVLKILNVKIEEGKNGNSDQMVISFDVAEGDQAGFFQKNYAGQQGEDKKWKGSSRLWLPKDDGSEQDEWTKRKFKTFIVCVEDSNDNYHWDWDESKLKGKLVGGIFNEKEWELNGNTGFFTNLHHFATAEKVRKNEYKIPDTTYLKNRQQASPMSDGFVDVKPGTPEEIPF